MQNRKVLAKKLKLHDAKACGVFRKNAVLAIAVKLKLHAAKADGVFLSFARGSLVCRSIVATSKLRPRLKFCPA